MQPHRSLVQQDVKAETNQPGVQQKSSHLQSETAVSSQTTLGGSASEQGNNLSRMTNGRLDRASHTILQLQNQLGNHHVQQLINPTQQITVQPRLMLGDVDTPSENQAEQVANEVTRDGQASTIPTPVSGGGMPVSPKTERSINQARGGGQSLPQRTQAQMGQALGTDLSNVRVHTGERAHTLNQSLQAKAFTTGKDIFFRQGAYNPGNSAGQQLLAHELTHVAQQQSMVSTQNNTIQRSITVDGDVYKGSELYSLYSRFVRAGISPSLGIAQALLSHLDSQNHTTDWHTLFNLIQGILEITKGQLRTRLDEGMPVGEFMEMRRSMVSLEDGTIIENKHIGAYFAISGGNPHTTAKDLQAKYGLGALPSYWRVYKNGPVKPNLRPVMLLADITKGASKGIVKDQKVYRGDARGPYKGYAGENAKWKNTQKGVLETGFISWGTNEDFYLHALGDTNIKLGKDEDKSGAYISTTSELSVANEYPKNETIIDENNNTVTLPLQEHGWIYQIKLPMGIDVNDMLGSISPFTREKETAVPYQIDARDIKFVRDEALGQRFQVRGKGLKRRVNSSPRESQKLQDWRTRADLTLDNDVSTKTVQLNDEAHWNLRKGLIGNTLESHLHSRPRKRPMEAMRPEAKKLQALLPNRPEKSQIPASIWKTPKAPYMKEPTNLLTNFLPNRPSNAPFLALDPTAQAAQIVNQVEHDTTITSLIPSQNRAALLAIINNVITSPQFNKRKIMAKAIIQTAQLHNITLNMAKALKIYRVLMIARKANF